MNKFKELYLATKEKYKDNPLKFFWFLTIGIVGFILSPLTWWNDVLVNFPIAFAFGYVVTMVLKNFMDIGLMTFFWTIAIGYWISNFLGFYLMHISIVKTTDKRPSIVNQVLVSVFYTVLIYLLVESTFFEDTVYKYDLVPPWVS